MKRGRRPAKAPTPQSNSRGLSVPTRPERYVRLAELVGEILADVHVRTIRAYEALEDGDPRFASDLLHDLAGALAEWRAAFEREAA
jgi:hypothetical protein